MLSGNPAVIGRQERKKQLAGIAKMLNSAYCFGLVDGLANLPEQDSGTTLRCELR